MHQKNVLRLPVPASTVPGPVTLSFQFLPVCFPFALAAAIILQLIVNSELTKMNPDSQSQAQRQHPVPPPPVSYSPHPPRPGPNPRIPPTPLQPQPQFHLQAQLLQIHHNELAELKKRTDNLENRFLKTQNELRETQAELREAQDELHETQIELRETQDEFRKNRDELRENQDELRENQDELRKTRYELREHQDKLRKTQDELRENQDGLRKTQDKLLETQEKLLDTQENVAGIADWLHSKSMDFPIVLYHATQKRWNLTNIGFGPNDEDEQLLSSSEEEIVEDEQLPSSSEEETEYRELDLLDPSTTQETPIRRHQQAPVPATRHVGQSQIKLVESFDASGHVVRIPFPEVSPAIADTLPVSTVATDYDRTVTATFEIPIDSSCTSDPQLLERALHNCNMCSGSFFTSMELKNHKRLHCDIPKTRQVIDEITIDDEDSDHKNIIMESEDPEGEIQAEVNNTSEFENPAVITTEEPDPLESAPVLSPYIQNPRTTIQQSLRRLANLEKNTYVCGDCNKSFSSKGNMRRHFKSCGRSRRHSTE